MANFLLHKFNYDFDRNSAVVISVNFVLILNPEKNVSDGSSSSLAQSLRYHKKNQTSTNSTVYVPGKDLGKSNFAVINL